MENLNYREKTYHQLKEKSVKKKDRKTPEQIENEYKNYKTYKTIFINECLENNRLDLIKKLELDDDVEKAINNFGEMRTKRLDYLSKNKKDYLWALPSAYKDIITPGAEGYEEDGIIYITKNSNNTDYEENNNSQEIVMVKSTNKDIRDRQDKRTTQIVNLLKTNNRNELRKEWFKYDINFLKRAICIPKKVINDFLAKGLYQGISDYEIDILIKYVNKSLVGNSTQEEIDDGYNKELKQREIRNNNKLTEIIKIIDQFDEELKKGK